MMRDTTLTAAVYSESHTSQRKQEHLGWHSESKNPFSNYFQLLDHFGGAPFRKKIEGEPQQNPNCGHVDATFRV